jgi:hypothetical protein
MPAITATSLTGQGARAVTETTLNGTDSLVYQPGDILILRNPTGAAISPTIVGSLAPSSFAVTGADTFNLSTGRAVGSIAASAVRAIPLDTIREYLAGTISITSGTGLIAVLLRPSA